MTTQEFFNKYNNKGIDRDGYYGYQCMDLAHQFAVEVNGIDFPPAPAAKDVWNKDCKGYDKIKNTPDGVPQKGDIIIWGTEIGQYGHIAVFDQGNASTFTSFDQNFPIGSLCHYQNHSYKGVLGWLRLKNRAVITQDIAQQPQILDQTKIPGLDNKEVQQIRAELEAKNRKIADDGVTIQRAIKDAEEAIADAKKLEKLLEAKIAMYDSLDAEFKAHLNAHHLPDSEEDEVETVVTTFPSVKPETPPKTEEPAVSGPLVDLLNNLINWVKRQGSKNG